MAPKGPITIRADIILSAGNKDTKNGRASLIVSEAGTRNVKIDIPAEQLGDLVMNALKCVLISASQPDQERDVLLETAARYIPVSATGWLDPSASNAPPGHSVLEILVAGVPLHFSAPTATWKGALEALSTQPSKNETMQ